MAAPLYTEDTFGVPVFNTNDLEPTFSQGVSGAVKDAWYQSYGPSKWAEWQMDNANKGVKLSKDDADSFIRDAGIPEGALKIQDKKYTKEALDVIIEQKQNELLAQDTAERTPYGVGTLVRAPARFVGGLADPVNIATSFFPAGKLAQAVKWGWAAKGLENLASKAATGESFLTRSIARAELGAVEGLVGTTALEPFYATTRNQLGNDYTAVDNLINIGMGGAFGGGLHVISGGFGDAIKSFRNKFGNKDTIQSPTVDQTQPETNQFKSEVTPNLLIRNELKLETNENGFLSLSKNERNFKEYLTKYDDAELADYINAKGDITYTGAQRIRADVVNNAINSPENILYPILNSLDETNNTIANGLFRASPIIRQARDANLNFRELDISRDIVDGLYRDNVSPEAQVIADVVADAKSPNEVAGFIGNYYKAVRDNPNVTKLEALKSALDAPFPKEIKDNIPPSLKTFNDTSASNMSPRDLVVYATPETKEAALKAAVQQLSDGKYVDVNDLVLSDPNIRRTTPEEAREALNRSLEYTNDQNVDVPSGNEITRDAKKFIPEEDPSWTNTPEIIKTIETINKHNEDMLASLKNEGLYSRGAEITEKPKATKEELTEAVRMSFKEDTDKMLKKGLVEIVGDVNELPLRRDGDVHPADVKAFFRDGKVYLVAQNIYPSQARGIIAHEIGVHAGLEPMLGTKGLKTIFQQVQRLIDEGDKAATIAYNDAIKANTPKAHIIEETLAYMLENMDHLPFIKKMMSEVKAWVYRTFPSVREYMKLNSADLYTIAKAAIRKYARDEANKRTGEFYSRLSTPEEIQNFRETIEEHDNAISQVETLRTAIRSAFSQINNKDDMILAIRAFDKNITLSEADKLVGQLYRKMNTIERQDAQGLTPEDMMSVDVKERALDAIMNRRLYELTDAKSKTINSYLKFTEGFNRIINNFSGVEQEGLYSLLVGSTLAKVGAKNSIGQKQSMYSSKYLGGFIANLKRDNLYKLFTSNTMSDDIMRAHWYLNRGLDTAKESPNIPSEAIAIAKHVKDAYDKTVYDRNLNGANIAKNKDYLMDNSYASDTAKIRAMTREEFKELALNTLDIEKMAEYQDVTPNQVVNELDKIYDDFSSGTHLKFAEPEEDITFLRSIGKQIKNKSRVFIFTDADSFIKYYNKVGSGEYTASVLQTLDKAGRHAGILDILGPRYEATLKKIQDAVALTITDPASREKFVRTATEESNMMLEFLDGRTNIPVNYTAARVMANVRSWIRMAKQGASVFASMTDFANTASELSFVGKGNLLENTLGAIGDMTSFGRYEGDRGAFLTSMGVFNESMMSSIFHHNGTMDFTSRIISKADLVYYSANLQQPWTTKIHQSHADALINYLGNLSDKPFNELHDGLKTMLKSYDINESEWNLLRQMNRKYIDGNNYLDPNQIETIRPQVTEFFKKQSPSVDEKVLKEMVDTKLNEMDNNLRNYYRDSTLRSTAEPTARSRFALYGNSRPGTINGEIMRSVGIFKLFPISMIQNVIGREIFTKGYDTYSNFIKNGKGDIVSLAGLIGMYTVLGYSSMVFKDLAKGRQPRDPRDGSTWLAAMLQGGALGIYGDFLFGNFNRFGNTVGATLGGPVLGIADDVMQLYSGMKDFITGDATAGDVGANAFQLLKNNTPFMNLFYTRIALDYMVLYNIQERLNPGYLSRLEDRLEQQNNQSYILPPSQYALQY